MLDYSYKYFSSLLSFLIHSLLLISFYYVALFAPQKSDGLINVDIEAGAAGNNAGMNKEEQIIKPESIEENYIKADKNIIGQTKDQANITKENTKPGDGSGTGTGTGTGSGVSLGLIPPSKPKEEEVYLVAVDEMPEPIGGIQKIISQIHYPSEAKQKGISGTVFVLAFIDENGSVRKTLLTKGIGGGCDEAALRVVSFSRFKPGKHKGRYVKVQIQIPVQFNLN